MSTSAVYATHVLARRGAFGAAAALLAISLLAAGCTSAASGGSSGSPAAATGTPVATAAATGSQAATSTAVPPAGPTLGAPPRATLETAGSGPLPGELGTFTWDGFGSDSPWIVAATGPATGAGSEVDISIIGFTPTAWTADWAPIGAASGTTGTAGKPTPAGSGSGGAPVRLRTPSVPGAWSLRLDVAYGEGREAMWFWRVEVRP